MKGNIKLISVAWNLQINSVYVCTWISVQIQLFGVGHIVYRVQ